jgi:hypothetical protein
MALTEDLSGYLADFGVPCSRGATNFIGLLDMPDNDFDVGGMSIQSTEYLLTFRSADITLAKGDAVTVNAIAYLVRSSDNLLDDGKFSAAKLSKI